MGFHIIQHPHHFLSQPDAFIGVNRLDPARTAGGDKGQVFRRRGPDDGDILAFLFFTSHVRTAASMSCSIRDLACSRSCIDGAFLSIDVRARTAPPPESPPPPARYSFCRQQRCQPGQRRGNGPALLFVVAHGLPFQARVDPLCRTGLCERLLRTLSAVSASGPQRLWTGWRVVQGRWPLYHSLCGVRHTIHGDFAREQIGLTGLWDSGETTSP